MSDKNKTINTSIADVKKKNTQNSELETQCLFGEQITVLQTEKNWSFCKLKLDGYLGWIKNKSFGDYFKTDHIISNPQTFIYKEPYYNSGIIFKLFMNSKIKILKVMGNWVKIYINKNKIGYVPKNHIRKKNEIKKNLLETLLMFKNTPYLWGGKSIEGIDCSGLVQICLETKNLLIPRNSSDQSIYKCNYLLDSQIIEKECLIFWKGHVAIAISNDTIIHSNSYHMSVTIEKVDSAIRRISKTDGSIICIKKLIY